MRLAILLALFAGCGATGDAGGGSSHLPASGSGPFQPLPSNPDLIISPPFVLTDSRADLDDPTVVADGDALALWVTARRNGSSRVEHADATHLLEGFGELIPAILADQPWEGSGVYGPSVIRDSPWILFYGGGGAIGWATAADGHTFFKAPGPALVANNLEEGTALGAPAAVRIGDRVRLYYAAGGVIWAAEAPYADVLASRATSWTRLDGDPTTPARDPMLAYAPFGFGLDRPSARAALTPAGRVRHDLYFTAYTGPLPHTSCGFASSFTGSQFAVAAAPILPLKLLTRAPAETPYGDGALLLYIQRFGARDAVAAALAP